MRSDSPQLFFQDLTGRLLVPAVYAGPVLHRLLYVCWNSLHFVLTLAAAVVNVWDCILYAAFNTDGYVLSKRYCFMHLTSDMRSMYFYDMVFVIDVLLLHG